MKKKILYFILTPILSIIFLEVCLGFYSKLNNIIIINDNRNSKLKKVYEEGKIFKSHDIFYTYKKNIINKRFINYYFDGNLLTKVWDYKFSTNNYGLVQKKDILKNRKSILFLGDSFTEGLGSTPWLDKFNGSINKYQIINGGFHGTGFNQFYNFEQFISKIFDIKYLVVLYIGGDIRRGLIKFNNTKCIEKFINCHPYNSHFGVPKDPNFNIEQNLENLLNSKVEKLNFKKKLKYFIRDTYIFSYSRTIINTLRLKNNQTVKNNLQSILNIKKEYQDKVIFIRINTPEEIAMKKISYESNLINNFMKINNIENFFCEMDNNLNMFHKLDYHPNKYGYDNLFNCVYDILSKKIIS